MIRGSSGMGAKNGGQPCIYPPPYPAPRTIIRAHEVCMRLNPGRCPEWQSSRLCVHWTAVLRARKRAAPCPLMDCRQPEKQERAGMPALQLDAWFAPQRVNGRPLKGHAPRTSDSLAISIVEGARHVRDDVAGSRCRGD